MLSPEPATRAGRHLELQAAALASAILAALAFPPTDLDAMAWLAWVPLLVALMRRPGVKAAALAGATHFAALHLLTCSWLLSVLRIHGGVSLPVALASLGVSGALFMPWGAAAGAAVGLSVRTRGVPGLLVACVAWPALDALRTRFPLGFPWWLPGMTQAQRPSVLGVAELGGVHAVSALVLSVNVAVVALLVSLFGKGLIPSRPDGRGDPRHGAAACAAAALVLAGAGLLHGAAAARAHRPAPGSVRPSVVALDSRSPSGGESAPLSPGGGTLRVGLVQGSVPQSVVLSPDPRGDVDRALRQLELGRRALDHGADFVAWSESAHPGSAGSHPWILRALSRDLALADATVAVGEAPFAASSGAGAPGASGRQPGAGSRHEAIVGVIVDALDREGRPGVANSAVLLDAQGLLDRYDKVALVPFGEYLPAPRLFFWVRALAAGVSEMVPGDAPRPVASSRGLIGASICYEAVLPWHSRELVDGGARLIVNLTNDGWFRDTAAPEQHLRFSSLRAVETRRWVVRCANSGISAIVAPDGSVVARLEEGRRGVLLGDVVLRDGATLYVQLGDAPLLAALLIAAAWVVRPAGRGSRRGTVDPESSRPPAAEPRGGPQT